MNDYVKIHLPGESPWGKVLQQDGDSYLVMIANKVAGDYSADEWDKLLHHLMNSDEECDGSDRRLHQYKMGDEIWVSPKDGLLQPVSRN